MIQKLSQKKQKTPIALIDCNNFFVSCERVFQPELCTRSVIVLSGKDGCVIARSNEVKALDVGMGEPIFRYKDCVEENDIALRTTNFALYTDISKRIMTTLKNMCPSVEQYSIDEAFCELDSDDLNMEGRIVKERIYKHIGMPVSVGIATTKTLAKIAIDWAKKDFVMDGVANFYNMDDSALDEVLKKIDVGDVWGIGRGHTGRLRSYDICSAYDLKIANVVWAKKECGITVAQIIEELRGKPVLLCGEKRKPLQSIMCSRSFKDPIMTKVALGEMIALYITRASEKLRKNGLQAQRVSVLIRSGRFDKYMHYSKQSSQDLDAPTAYTPQLIACAQSILDEIYRDGVRYKKAGIYLSRISSFDHEQLTFFAKDDVYTPAQKKLMSAQDSINKKYGQDMIKSASLGMETTWISSQSLRSQRFTTQWDELLKIKI